MAPCCPLHAAPNSALLAPCNLLLPGSQLMKRGHRCVLTTIPHHNPDVQPSFFSMSNLILLIPSPLCCCVSQPLLIYILSLPESHLSQVRAHFGCVCWVGRGGEGGGCVMIGRGLGSAHTLSSLSVWTQTGILHCLF